MQPLGEVQQRIRDAVVGGDSRAAIPLLAGGRAAEARLAIHRRHYEVSLVSALMGRFPATGWLMGTPMLEAAARMFVRAHPPSVPCIAEYGAGFPSFLASSPGAERVPILEQFADLDWHLGRLALAVDLPPMTRDDISALPPENLADITLTIQSGAHYVAAAAPIDDLIRVYLAADVPERLELPDTPVWFEVRGARGVFRFTRLTRPAFVFRTALVRGLTIGESTLCAWEAEGTFDPGAELASMVDAGLITAIGHIHGEDR